MGKKFFFALFLAMGISVFLSCFQEVESAPCCAHENTAHAACPDCRVPSWGVLHGVSCNQSKCCDLNLCCSDGCPHCHPGDCCSCCCKEETSDDFPVTANRELDFRNGGFQFGLQKVANGRFSRTLIPEISLALEWNLETSRPASFITLSTFLC